MKIFTYFTGLLLAAIFIFSGCGQKSEAVSEQAVLESTMNISKKYLALRYQTDNVLVNAENFADYDEWNNEMSGIINGWEELEKEAVDLEKESAALAEEKVSYDLINSAYAYDKQEISNIIDSAPMGKKIQTLAKHLGVDAKKAQLILNQDQAQVTREAWGEAGDTFENLENSAVAVKDGCKIAGFVGGIALSGGVSAIAAGSTLTQAAVVVSGADLALEVTDDGARMALGNGNKISAFVNDARKVTAPVATILTITDIPNNLSKGIDKFNAVMIGLEQFRSAAQEGQVVGIALPAYSGEPTKNVEVAILKPEEVKPWLKEKGAEYKPETAAEVEQALGIEKKEVQNNSGDAGGEAETADVEQPQDTDSRDTEEKQDTDTGNTSAKSMAGSYSGNAVLQHVIEDVEAEDSLPVTLQLNENGTGTVNVNGFGGNATYAGSKVHFSVKMKEDGATVYCTFDGRASGSGDSVGISGTMTFTMMGVDFATYSWSAQK
ncbi:MAG: hypothetical protein ACOYUZ_04865 [Patescibacteria group bacterium]